MFNIEKSDIKKVLARFGVEAELLSTETLLRYSYPDDTRQVRLIMKCNMRCAAPLIVKFKNEEGVTRETIEAQCAFSAHLSAHGVRTAQFLKISGAYCAEMQLNGYDVLVTAEYFMPGEIKLVDAEIAERTGALLAMTHNISEKGNCHVDSPVLFDPFAEWNDLFSYKEFSELAAKLTGADAECAARIDAAYKGHMAALDGLSAQPRYAVQGDISDCNLFISEAGDIGMFDFNRCGDNILFCDAVMQGVFEARLMDYGATPLPEFSRALFGHFMRGYTSVRPFTEDEKRWLPHLYAIINAFWLSDIIYDDSSLKNLMDEGRDIEISAALLKIEHILTGRIKYKDA